ncbi:membrane protein [Rhizobium leguminosarum bv. trifolii CB782]|uniref:Uncharacterized protein n=1 Tax=Rhizobium hidalgonense TaxID=1538159 RepID=A0A2A6KD78_9HYPH|nr:hypothetical protein [Rhizobium hidalgonense]AHG45150.1 membrane protein [Rhizobium leguminosarum bv. trifolii CB782]MDR9774446.1 hypothetical protein [Rhizobium hidalgonense]MDR9805206.1 hypothetical protein [Rhizobium hidalgonense]MDR9809570.1 hypothetical protein [Rhizobium hidalgonense]MDR9821058.1 hypothetical protein [Rhizobium hidalgonense]
MTNGNDYGEARGGEKPGKRAKRFGIDHASGRLLLGSFSIGLPRSRIARMGIGVALILCGFLGFLPILGFWMLPLGFLVLSHDLPVARRLRRRLAVWWHRRRKPAD